jgi:tyrosyl-tRNA synthetase
VIRLDITTRLELIRRAPTEEIITEPELRQLLETEAHPKHYIGFEISGPLHLGTLFISGHKINDLIRAGCDCKIYLADWHSFINEKLGGSWPDILRGAKYYEEAFKFFCPKARVVLGSELYHHNDDYWKDLMALSRHMTLARTVRCLTIMGRSERERLHLAQYMYPPMQAVDVKYLGPDLPHGGMDQRKAHVLCREIFPKLGWKKPVALHHHLLMGLAPPPQAGSKLERVVASKMSKSKPWTCIFIHDTAEEIGRKLDKAWCPERQVELNPVIELVRYLIFRHKEVFVLEREQRYGGTREFHSYTELETSYRKGEIHPQDLKVNVARELDEIVSPVRAHFERPRNRRLVEVFRSTSE